MKQIQVMTRTDSDGGNDVLPDKFTKEFSEVIKQIKNKTVIKHYFEFLTKVRT